MVRPTALTVGDHAVEGFPINKAKGEKMVLEPPMNIAQRKKLGDITNFEKQNKLLNKGAKQQQEAIFVSSIENAENLKKENMRLMNAVVERDRIKSELQKFRIALQKVHEQNLLLAQANTRILAEFNSSKDQLKILQHELGCKNGLLMARKTLLKEQILPCTCTCHASKVKPNDESSDLNSLQINAKANSKGRVFGRKNPANSEVLYVIGRPGETCQTEDNVDNKKLVSDGDNAADKKEFALYAGNHITDNVQSKRYCTGRQSASFKTRETGQTENLQYVVDAKKVKEKERFSLTEHPAWLQSQEPEPSENLNESSLPLRRRSARLKSQEPEPSESFHESKQTTRRRSEMLNFKQLGVIQNLNGLHDDQQIVANAGFVANAGCSGSEQLNESKPQAVEQFNDTKEITRKSRVSLRRQSTRINFQELGIAEILNCLHNDQAIATKAGCSASEQSIGSKPETVEPHDTREKTGKSSVFSRRQSENVKPQKAITEFAGGSLHDCIVEESSQISSSVSMELKRESKNKPTEDETEEMRRTSIGRPKRQAAGKIITYKEVSLKEKMRRSF